MEGESPVLRHGRNVNLQFKKYFKSAELLNKTSVFLYFRNRPSILDKIFGDFFYVFTTSETELDHQKKSERVASGVAKRLKI